jgi:hypothetical protein
MLKKIAGLVMVALFLLGCQKPKVGCTNPLAANYKSDAIEDDGTCTIKYEGTYLIKEFLFVNGVETESKTYSLKISFLSTEDSIQLDNMWDYGKTLVGTKSKFTFTIPEQAYDQNTTVTGEGTFDFGKLTYETAYGDLRHIGEGTRI